MRNLKRALSLALASVMLLGMMVVGTSAAGYPDVTSKDNLEAIEVLKMVGVMTGDENGNFNPNKNVTRNEMAVVMCNLLGLKTGGSTPFTDVPAWATPYVAACYNNGIIAGTSATTFGGDASVTAVQAGLMVMKALGYFGYQGEFGDDWKLAVVKQADKIDLYDGINAYTDQVMTRGEIAQMVLNALECTIQVVTEQGGMTVDGNGIVVNVKASYKYEDAENKSGKDYKSRTSYAAATMELCEKLYNNNLKKVENYTAGDDFGRPATKWTYGNDNIITAKEPDLTYTKEVKGKEIYADLGKVTPTNIVFIRNNETQTAYTNADTPAALTIKDNDNGKIGGKGTLIEVYYNNEDLSNTTATIVAVDTFLAQATEDFDESDKEVDIAIKSALETSATLKADDFAVANVKKDDYLLVNLAKDGSSYKVKTVSFPSIVENAVVTTARSGDYVIADGTKYEYASVAKADSNTLGQGLMTGSSSYDINGDGYNLYLDSYGYVVGVKGYSAGVNLDDYLFVKSVSTNGFDAIAKVMFADGTTKTVTVDKLGSTDIDKANCNLVTEKKFYTFDTDKDGNYELTLVPASGSGETQGMAASATVKNEAKPISGVANAGTSTTVFIAKDKVYTGVKKAPKVTAAGAVYYVLDENARLLIVYAENKGSASSNANDLVYILNNNPAKAKDGDDTYYIYDAIVDGVKTTLEANNNSKPAGLYEIETYTDGRADLGTAIAVGSTVNELVNNLGTISSADYKDGTLTLGSESYLVSDDVTVITIDGNTVKTISASGVKKAVTDGFNKAIAIETSTSNSDIITVYLSK